MTKTRRSPKPIRGPKKLFAFDLTYFDRAGKCIRSETYEYVCATVHGSDTPFMTDVAAHVRGLLSNGGQTVEDKSVGYVLIDYCDYVSRIVDLYWGKGNG